MQKIEIEESICMKKILHLFRSEKFTEGFIRFINSESEFEHTFWIYGEAYLKVQKEAGYLRTENVKYYPRIDIKLNKSSTREQMEEFDLIIYHGVFEDIIIDFFFENKKLLKKLILYFWGGDKEIDGSWKANVKRKNVIKNAAAIVTIIPQDYKDIKKKYQPRGKHFCAKYFNKRLVDALDIIKVRQPGECINIQIGNSATATNKHIDVLNILEKYKKKNIRIYIPLSYGEKEYAKRVIEHGKSIFGEKLIPIVEYMPFEAYCSFMSTIDIAIFNMLRQQALSNIRFQIQSGKKIYFNKHGELWDYFVNDLKCAVSDIDEINERTFEEFIRFSQEEKQRNAKIVSKNFGRENSIRQWEGIFSAFL